MKPNEFTWTDRSKSGSPEPEPERCGFKLPPKHTDGEPRYCKQHRKKGERYCARHSRGVHSINAPPRTRKTVIRKPGFYDRGILPGEEAAYNEAQVGTLDDEIRLTRLQLRRTLQAQRAYFEALAADNVDDQGFVLMEVEVSDFCDVDPDTLDVIPGKRKIRKIRRRNDFGKEIEGLTKLIATLERTRAELKKDEPKEASPQLTALIDALSAVRGE